ncbi:ribonuclease H-like domain-containing protein [Candidatus Poribacteria bacterium]
MSLPPDFKKRLAKIMQEKRGAKNPVQAPQQAQTDLEAVIPGKPVAAGSGEFYLVQRNLSELYTEADALVEKHCELFASDWKERPDIPGMSDDFKAILNAGATKAIFLDAETTGFSNTPLFLLGVMYFDGESFIIDQLFARDYSEEANLLQYFSEFAPKFDILVTFNGKSFDAPFIRDRMVYHRMPFEWTQVHVDILHHARRRWKNELPNCKLQTLESYICQRRRVGDVPGALVPDVYREFVRSGSTQLLADVFHHNALDVITLAELTIVLLS